MVVVVVVVVVVVGVGTKEQIQQIVQQMLPELEKCSVHVDRTTSLDLICLK